MRVHINSHVEFEGHYYSVPHALVGLALELRVSTHAVEALHKGHRVAGHRRSAHKGGYTTVIEHLPERHQHHPPMDARAVGGLGCAHRRGVCGHRDQDA